MTEQQEASATEEIPKFRTNIGWMVGKDGKPYVTITDDIPAGSHAADDIASWAGQFRDAAERAITMAAAWHWLKDGGVERDRANQLLLKLNDAKDRDALTKAIGELRSLF